MSAMRLQDETDEGDADALVLVVSRGSDVADAAAVVAFGLGVLAGAQPIASTTASNAVTARDRKTLSAVMLCPHIARTYTLDR
jgi:hypothetical protein